MDKDRKKQLIEAYKNRYPEMGIISFKCKNTGETFLGIAKDIKAEINSNTVKLGMNYHPNKRLLALWNEYGQDGFEISVVKRLKYENPHDDHIPELEKMREECFAQDPDAVKIWK